MTRTYSGSDFIFINKSVFFAPSSHWKGWRKVSITNWSPLNIELRLIEQGGSTGNNLRENITWNTDETIKDYPPILGIRIFTPFSFCLAHIIYELRLHNKKTEAAHCDIFGSFFQRQIVSVTSLLDFTHLVWTCSRQSGRPNHNFTD